jgi:hypothetical protein
MIGKTIPIITGAVVAGLLAAMTPDLSPTRQVPPVTGQFRGYAEIFVSWTGQRTLLVDISIAPDASFTGCIGDANLVNGQLRSDRGWLARKLGWKRDWIVTGDLAGPIVARDSVVRAGVTMPIDWTGNRFVGGLTTTGAEFGGKERMKLSAGRMEVLPVAPLTPPTREPPCQP